MRNKAWGLIPPGWAGSAKGRRVWCKFPKWLKAEGGPEPELCTYDVCNNLDGLVNHIKLVHSKDFPKISKEINEAFQRMYLSACLSVCLLSVCLSALPLPRPPPSSVCSVSRLARKQKPVTDSDDSLPTTPATTPARPLTPMDLGALSDQRQFGANY